MKVSVIIPCHNVEPYIDRTLSSLSAQTIGIDCLEIICVDDASTDRTWEHLLAWEQKYPDNILLVQCEENGRQGKARNIGLTHATADWIAFIDSDDWVEPDYLEKLFQSALDTQSDVVCCRFVRDPDSSLSLLSNRETGKENRLLVIDSEEKRKVFLITYSMESSCWGKLIRKTLLTENTIFFPEGVAYEDNLWSSLLHIYAGRVYMLEEILYHYYVNDSSTTLEKNALRHVDLLTVYIQMWEIWEKRGLLSRYRTELEFHFLCSGYLCFMKILFLRYSAPPYSLYLLGREITNGLIEDYRMNPYIQDNLSEFYHLVLKSLTYQLTDEQFQTLTRAAQKYYLVCKEEHYD